MNKYELITIIKNTDTAELDNYKKSLREVLKKHNIEVSKEEEWGTRNVHHELEGTTTGFFMVSNCIMAPDKVVGLKRDLQITDGIMRHMIKRSA